MKRVFITVGSTHFDELVDAALTDGLLAALRARGAEEVIIQSGSYKGNDARLFGISNTPRPLSDDVYGLSLQVFTYKPTLANEFQNADLIISHAGSGTIIDVLRLGKPLIAVPNSSLLDNHQQELARELEKLGHLKAATPETLHECIESFDAKQLKPFPRKEKGKFQGILDEMMGLT